MRNEVLPRHKDLFYTSFERHKEMERTSRGLQQWISTWGAVVHTSVEKAKKFGIQRMRIIKKYFNQDMDDA